MCFIKHRADGVFNYAGVSFGFGQYCMHHFLRQCDQIISVIISSNYFTCEWSEKTEKMHVSVMIIVSPISKTFGFAIIKTVSSSYPNS